MTKTFLCLDDALQNSPQTRCLLKLFEEDASKLHNYMGHVRSSFDRLLAAQTEVTSALQQLGAILGDYGRQEFPLDHGETEFPCVVNKFHQTISEMSSCMEVVGQQLQNCVVYPVSKFLRELDEVEQRKEMYHTFEDDLSKSIEKYAKVSRKEPQKKVDEVSEELCNARRRFHQNALRYYIQLNNLQYTRRNFLLEPILSLLYAYRSLFHMGHQALTQQSELTEFFTRTQEQVQSLHIEQQSEENSTKEFMKTFSEIERLQPDIYYAEPLSEQTAGVIDTKITQKQGYLFLKTKGTLVSRWEHLYFFTQGGNLMCRSKDELAGQLLLELTNDVGAGVTDTEDRRHTFMITSTASKKQFILQALNQKDRDEWIYAINNLSKDGGALTPSPPTGGGKLSQFRRMSSDGSPKKSKQPEEHGTTQHHQQQQSQQQQHGQETSESMVFTAPIQFDLLSPGDDDDDTTGEAHPVSTGEHAKGFDVRFLGCMEVAADRGEQLAVDAVRQISAARVMHGIVKAAEVRLTCQDGKLRLSESSGACKASFQLDDLSYWCTHPESERYVALIIRTKGGRVDGRHKFSCYVLESTGVESGQDICDTLGEATKAAFEAVFRKKASFADQTETSDQPPATGETKEQPSE